MKESSLILFIFLLLYALHIGVRSYLQYLNRHHLRTHGHKIPDAFAGEIDESTLTRMRDYSFALNRLGTCEQLLFDGVILLIMLSGFLPWLTGREFFQSHHFIISGLVYFFLFGLMSALLEIPFDLYRTFVIERRFSFSTITPGIWTKDLIISFTLSTALMGIVLVVLLGLMHAVPSMWWLLVWIFFVLFQLVISWAYPVLIAPLFNTFTPLEDRSLKEKIKTIFTQAGLKVSGIFTMDAGKRSRHSNAYFTGIGKTKRIVLFDTLLDNHSPDEIGAVLAHELGHWKKGHVKLQIALSIVLSLGVLYSAYHLVNTPLIYEAFDIAGVIPYAGLFILAVLFKPVSYFMLPLGSMLSRHFERQADEYALALIGSPEHLVKALKHLARDNLSNLHPHPLYAWFYYSHPPLVDRITRLEAADAESLRGS